MNKVTISPSNRKWTYQIAHWFIKHLHSYETDFELLLMFEDDILDETSKDFV